MSQSSKMYWVSRPQALTEVFHAKNDSGPPIGEVQICCILFCTQSHTEAKAQTAVSQNVHATDWTPAFPYVFACNKICRCEGPHSSVPCQKLLRPYSTGSSLLHVHTFKIRRPTQILKLCLAKNYSGPIIGNASLLHVLFAHN